MPLTLLRLEPGHRFAVIEMGANRAGEVAELVKVARPTVGLITNAGAEHLEGFGSLEGVARAEGETVAGLAADATAVLNADDEFASLWRGMTPARVVTFGIAERARTSAQRTCARRSARRASALASAFRARSGRRDIELHVGGRHNVANALGRRRGRRRGRRNAGAHRRGPRRHAAGAGSPAAEAGRLRRVDHRRFLQRQSELGARRHRGARLDRGPALAGARATWRSSASSPRTRTRRSAPAPASAGSSGCSRPGALAALAVERFGAGGQWFPDTAALTRELLRALLRRRKPPTDVRLLVKGSRVNRLERVVAALVADTKDNPDGH